MEVRHIEGQADVRGLIRAHGLAWRDAYDGLLPPEILQEQTINPTEEDVQQWREGLRENQEGVLVAVDDEHTCGTLSMMSKLSISYWISGSSIGDN